MQLTEKLKRVRTHLVLDHPFFGALALKMKMTEGKGQTRTDGTHMFVDPERFTELTHDEQTADFAEAVLHNAHGHPGRGVGRDSKQWDRACDMAIYKTMRDAGFTMRDDFEQPMNGEGKSAEEYYRILQEMPQEDGGGGDGDGDSDSDDPGSDSPGAGGDPGDGSGDGGGDGDGDGADADGPGVGTEEPKNEDGSSKGRADLDELETEWKIAASQAAKAAKAMGKMPGCLSEFIEDLLEPKVDWRALLREYLEATARNDYDWMVPDRNFLQQNIVLPTLQSEECPEIAVAFDTSGSVSRSEYEQFIGELNSILEDMKATVHCLWVDTRVAHYELAEPEDQPILYKRYGGGGTCFVPPFEHLAENDIEPKCLIYLTDGECTSFADEPDYPVLWITTQKADEFGGQRWGGSGAPYGEVVELVMD